MKRIPISQCMIVKNEERNIRRALQWAKDIVCEQIVVDTGSTDRTVEIAKEMGATVYHFEWNDDFSAAKNFAIDQAKGKWIFFLDADEYVEEKDVPTLYQIVEDVEWRNLNNKNEKLDGIIRLKLWNVRDDHSLQSSGTQDRIFLNQSDLRYKNRIHESLYCSEEKYRILYFDEVTIFHTGYSKSEYKRTNKEERNIRLLKKEIGQDPNNMEWWAYLGDAYASSQQYALALDAYKKVVEKADIQDYQLLKSMCGVIRILLTENKVEEIKQYYTIFLSWNKKYPDIEYFIGKYYFEQGNATETIRFFERTLQIIEEERQQLDHYNLQCVTNLGVIYNYLSIIYTVMDKKVEAVKYTVLSLRVEKYAEDVCIRLLKLFFDNGERAENVYQFLSKIYDFSNQKDRLFVLLAEKKAGYARLKKYLLALMSEEEQEEITHRQKLQQEREQRKILQEKYPDIVYKNDVDYYFMKMLDQIEQCSKYELVELMKTRISSWKEKAENFYNAYIQEIKRQYHWGSLDIERGIYEAFQEKAYVLKQYKEDLIWLYQQLRDYKSKKILTAILMNWIQLDTDLLELLKNRDMKYLDLDTFSVNNDTVLVEVGLEQGSAMLELFKYYDTMYQKVYAYDEKQQLVENLNDMASNYPNVQIQCMTIGKEKEEQVENLDHLVKEPIGILKVDVQGMEQEVLLGSEQQIRKNKPQIAVAVHHRYEQLLTIPKLLKEMRPDYQFTLNYCGSSLVPTEVILFAY